MGFKTFVAGDVFTAAEANDYLMEQAVIACTSGTRPSSPNEGMKIYQTDTDTFAVYNGSAWCETTPEAARVSTNEATTSTSYTDLATSGPATTQQTATKVLVTIGAYMSCTTAAQAMFMSYAVSGATTVAASDEYAMHHVSSSANIAGDQAKLTYYASLTAGVNTFTAKYRTGSGTSSIFVRREISSLPLP